MSRMAFGWMAGIGAGLLALLAAEIVPIGRAGPDIANVRAAPAPGRALPPPEAGLESASLGSVRVASILARPLFDRSRRPAGATEPVAGVLRLTGVVVGPSGREAIFQPLRGGKPVVVFEGERVNGALVRVIAPGAVLMVDGSGAHLISPAYAPGPPAPPPGSMLRPGASQ